MKISKPHIRMRSGRWECASWLSATSALGRPLKLMAAGYGASQFAAWLVWSRTEQAEALRGDPGLTRIKRYGIT